MASNWFGNLFRITTWGESHGPAIGVVIDGCPAGLELCEKDVHQELLKRSPGFRAFTSERRERDQPQILSGVFEGKTTGTPISILIANEDANSTPYEKIKQLYRPGHAQFTYLQKYGIYDHRGGGRASARETACRVAAGAVAKKLLSHFGIEVLAYLKKVSEWEASVKTGDRALLKSKIEESPIFCPDEAIQVSILSLLEEIKQEGDSIGAVVEFLAFDVPVGFGDPVYEKLEANLAKAMLSLPASKGFEIGEGFHVAELRGSNHNDLFKREKEERVTFDSNHAGGILGGISTGMPIVGRVAFKPTSSIKKVQSTVGLDGESALFQLPEGSRHDPCVGIRAVPIVEAMVALVLADFLLLNRSARL